MDESRKAAKQKGPSWERAVKRKTPPGVIIGILFCIIGGALLATAFILPWVELFDPVTGQLTQTYYAHDLFNYLSSFYGPNYKFLIAYVIPLAGIVCAVLAAMELLGERGNQRLRRFSPPAALMSALVGLVCTILTVFFIDSDIFSSTVDRASFGSAAFVSVFGSVFALSGGLVMMGDFRHRTRAGTGFKAASGNKEIKSALRPTGSFGRMARAQKAEDEELKGKVLASEVESYDGPERSGSVCPNCSSPVMGNWKLCPICGTELE
ncbi:MAG: hypothetical protein LUO79_05340 [Methanomassiliicoccales archaeon]|nr:hypothetical protein [Methanomassiliicoccales archaeon]